jgi:CUB/sushi domain-containing protein
MGLKQFDAGCDSDKHFAAIEQHCQKVTCGECPKEDFAVTKSLGQVFFQDMCSYTCEAGYTLNQEGNGPTGFTLKCLATGRFTEPRSCLPVSCGAAQKIAHATIQSAHADAVHFPDSVEFDCDVGYTLTGAAGAPATFERTCEDDGTFSPAERCKPVKCGKPAAVKHSTYVDVVVYFAGTVSYTCDSGYTMTGKAGGSNHETIACGADGKFEKDAPVCMPVECGAPPTVEKGSVQGTPPAVVTYADEALAYECAPGYSTSAEDNPWAPAENSFLISCEADGTFQAAPSCVNINDCLVHDCGPNGACVDVADPNGIPFDDYTCTCNAGFMITLQPGTTEHTDQEKVCTNIDDCPVEDACGGYSAEGFKRGTCDDLIMDYTCICGSGYELAFLKAPPTNRTCAPVECGVVEEVREATHPVVGPANYDTPAWNYTCNKGYTTNGQAAGPTHFAARCKATGVFSKPSECSPVTCGTVKAAANADRDTDPGELFFPEAVTYTCDDGYSLDSKADGEKSFKVTCEADGKQSALQTCAAVECGEIPVQKHASIEVQKVYTFGKSGTVECDTGYSLDGSTNKMRMDYERTCQADGTFSEEKPCQPVECGTPPDVRHAAPQASSLIAQPASTQPASTQGDVKVFGDEVAYKLDAGYSLDGTTAGATSFTMSCKSDGKFSRPQELLPISCGHAPAREHASTPGAKYVFQETADYTCLSGFSTDGTAAGSKEFTLECAATGEYTGDGKCSPVSCGAVAVPKTATQVADSDDETHKSLVFGQHAQLECKPGYSLDGKLKSTQLRSKVQCQADGSLLYPPECKNDDDCVAPDNMCSPHGTCKDKANPTGDHLKDFECICDSGFKANVTKAGVRSCAQIPDCPLGACDPGTCTDLINDYKCNCPAGYTEEADKSRDLAHACLPVPCGKPPKVPEATTEQAGDDIYFNMAPVAYECEEGYTLDATPRGENRFTLACLEQGTFERAPSCEPVECGQALPVDHAHFNKDHSWTFGQSATYTCDSGYAVGGTANGAESFKATCEADGTFWCASLRSSRLCVAVRWQGQPAPTASNGVCSNNHFGHVQRRFWRQQRLRHGRGEQLRLPYAGQC